MSAGAAVLPEGMRRQHPIAILQYTYRSLYLLLVPLLRGLSHIRTPEGLYNWLRGTWIDVLAVALLLVFPLLAWSRHTFALTDKAFIIRRGVVVQRTTVIPRQHIATLFVEQPFLLRPLQAVRLSIDTDAGGRRRVDFRLTLHARRVAAILEQQPAETQLPQEVYRAKISRVLLLSLLSSNSFSGILLLALTFQRAGYLWGQAFQNKVWGDLEAAAEAVKVIPRTAALLAILLLGGWCVAATGNLLRHSPFRVIRCAGNLTLRVGFITRREYMCRLSAVNYVDIRQTLGSRLLRLRTVFIRCIGYGKAKNTLSVLLPFCREKTAQAELARLLPEYRSTPVSLRPIPRSLPRYCLFPLVSIAVLHPASLLLQWHLPAWEELIGYLTFMALLPCLWLLAIRVIDRYTAGLAHRDGMITMRYARLFTLHTVLIPEDKVVSVRLTQSIFQRRVGSCTVRLYTYNEARQPHRLLNVPFTEATQLFDGLLTQTAVKDTD